MKIIQSFNREQLQRKDIIDLFNWIRHIYGSDIKAILLNYHSEIWYKTLVNLSRVQLVNGFRNLVKLKNQAEVKQLLFFPVSAKHFLKLSLKGSKTK